MRVFLSINSEKEKIFPERIRELTEWCDAYLDVVTSTDKADVILSLGGDGTLLYDINRYGVDFSYCGVNLGHLGFLTSAEFSNYKEKLKNMFLDKEYKFEEIYRLKYKISEKFEYAINDLVIKGENIEKAIKCEVLINGEFVYNHFGDGIIISTPVGSTAYNLSVGGPILNPLSRTLVLNNIAPHFLGMRPLILFENDIVTIVPEKKVAVIADGNKIDCTNERIDVKISKIPIKIMRSSNWSFYDVLKKKLHWAKRGDGNA